MEPGSGRKANGSFPMWPRFSGCLGDEWDEIGLMKSVNGEITSMTRAWGLEMEHTPSYGRQVKWE